MSNHSDYSTPHIIVDGVAYDYDDYDDVDEMRDESEFGDATRVYYAGFGELELTSDGTPNYVARVDGFDLMWTVAKLAAENDMIAVGMFVNHYGFQRWGAGEQLRRDFRDEYEGAHDSVGDYMSERAASYGELDEVPGGIVPYINWEAMGNDAILKKEIWLAEFFGAVGNRRVHVFREGT